MPRRRRRRLFRFFIFLIIIIRAFNPISAPCILPDLNGSHLAIYIHTSMAFERRLWQHTSHNKLRQYVERAFSRSTRVKNVSFMLRDFSLGMTVRKISRHRTRPRRGVRNVSSLSSCPRRHRPKIAFSYAKLDILDGSFPTDAQRHIHGFYYRLFWGKVREILIRNAVGWGLQDEQKCVVAADKIFRSCGGCRDFI